jgi:predicted TIM-barrel enzyme
MVHVQALPGTPRARHTLEQIEQAAVIDSKALLDAGFHAIIIENMHDAPYLHGEKGPETTAVMTRVALAVRRALGERVPLGVQVLSGGNREAVAVALAAASAKSDSLRAGWLGGNGGAWGGSAGFIRCENFVFSHVADEGLLMKAEAGELLRYRRTIGADGAWPMGRAGRIAVLCDIKKKHASHALTADVSIEQAAEAAEFFGADGVIVTGSATGKPTSVDEVRLVSKATRLPVLVGSGVSPKDAPRLLEHADALIVGSWIKQGGRWRNAVDQRRARELVRATGL